jgi:hypothetical protein
VCACNEEKKEGKRGHYAVKLDMMKAYDRVEWPFVEAILSKLGFPPRLVQLITKCVSSVKLSFQLK